MTTQSAEEALTKIEEFTRQHSKRWDWGQIHTLEHTTRSPACMAFHMQTMHHALIFWDSEDRLFHTHISLWPKQDGEANAPECKVIETKHEDLFTCFVEAIRTFPS